MKKDDDNHNVTVRAAETFPTTISHHFNIQKMSSILCLFPSFFLFLFACIFIGNLISLFRSLFTSMPHLTASRVEQASLARCFCKLLFFFVALRRCEWLGTLKKKNEQIYQIQIYTRFTEKRN